VVGLVLIADGVLHSDLALHFNLLAFKLNCKALQKLFVLLGPAEDLILVFAFDCLLLNNNVSLMSEKLLLVALDIIFPLEKH